MRILRKVAMQSLALAALVGASTAAYASDGQITFNGQVTGTTCTINGGTPNLTVTLPTVSTTALGATNATAGRTPFSIALTNCTAADATTVGAYFEPAANVSVANGVLINAAAASPATNVAVQLLNNSFGKIQLGSTTQNGTTATITTGAATLNYYAEYLATGAVGAGAVQTTALYSIVYP